MRLPHAEPGNRIGLFGGSFNPPHSGHRTVAETALKRCDLDQVWWLVTPGNPLKEHGGLAPLEERVDAVRKLARHPRMKVTAFEALIGTTYSARLVARLLEIRPRLRFAWIMGADNLMTFHRWQSWRSILENVPLIVVDRPDASFAPLKSVAANAYAPYRWDESRATTLAGIAPPAWTFLHTRLDDTSSTALRAQRCGHATVVRQ
ncbi:nicotinate-nucleotide adenylyltransferase [Stappia sp. GBMRC 2046]|uniref:Probable nicotinate-nucleotide adenylyltransferase n=2 Tax=Stappia sediminis TaxID=2692190 RepID=A0A7X3S9E6_9HYPH|nr:nicotinate-nucleotide adenylyltransferase [Stappia sediminis]